MKRQVSPFIPPVLLACFLLTVAGCKKPFTEPPSAEPPQETEVPRLLNIAEDGAVHPIETYEYNAKGLLGKITHYMNAGVPLYFYYDGTGKPVLAKTFLPESGHVNDSYKFYYADGRLDRLEMLHTNFDQTSTPLLWTFKNLYKDGRLIGSESYRGEMAGPNLAGRTAYTFYPNGDVKTERTEGRNFATGTFYFLSERSFEYDTKANPVKKWGELLPGFNAYFSSSPHNITKRVTVEGPNRKVAEVLTRSYTYDRKGFPLSAVERLEYPEDPQYDGSTQKLLFTYQ